MDLTTVSPTLLRTGTEAQRMQRSEAVEEFEAMLATEMIKAAREAGKALAADEDQEAGSETYLEFAEEHLARAMAKSGILGFGKLLEADLQE